MSEHEELKATGNLLSSALDKYLDTSLAFRNSYVERNSSAITPPGLPSRAESELQFLAALELKLQMLPQELLARVFLFVFGSRPSSDWKSRPEAVSYVCARWRKLSLSLPLLWCRINLPFIRIIDNTLVTRGKLFASRAHPLPLDISLYALYRHPTVLDGSRIGSLIHEIAPHIGSLEFDTHWKECNLILSSFLPKCQPGILKTLITCHDSPSGVFFAVASGLPSYLDRHYSVMQIGDSTTEIGDFDRVLASVTTLRLNGFYPFWTSQAYHGLIELRLIRGALRPNNAVISEDDLIGIIRASPALRILQFSLTIVQVLSAEPLVSPISLEHLELLNVAGMAPNELGTLLRWVAPDPKPLRLAINLDSDCSSDTAWLRLPDNEVTSFFARSHVSKIYTEHGDYKTLFHLLDLCPRLKTLACSYIKASEPQSHLPEQDGLFISHPALESLLILKGSVNTTPLLNTISGSPTLQIILFWKCYYYDGRSSKSLCVDNLEVMVGLGPVVQIIDYDPTRDWEISAP